MREGTGSARAGCQVTEGGACPSWVKGSTGLPTDFLILSMGCASKATTTDASVKKTGAPWTRIYLRGVSWYYVSLLEDIFIDYAV
jgi:hypothetical protein